MTVNMMYLFAPFRSLRKGAVRLVEMDFADGRNSMVFVTGRGGIRGLEAQVGSMKTLRGLLKKATVERVKVFLPRFAISSALELSKPLAALGFGPLFARGADFTGLTKVPLFLSTVQHGATLRVDEKGVVATAATAIFALKNGNPAYPKLRFDHPFLYFIIDKRNDLVLFAGRVMVPTAARGSLTPRRMRH